MRSTKKHIAMHLHLILRLYISVYTLIIVPLHSHLNLFRIIITKIKARPFEISLHRYDMLTEKTEAFHLFGDVQQVKWHSLLN